MLLSLSVRGYASDRERGDLGTGARVGLLDDRPGPLVSVVVPVYRTEEHLEACLSSLLCQTFTDFEVIVVDDASPGGDGVVDGIVREIGDGRVTIIRHSENLGLMQARYTGVRAALGAYVSFVDSDDEVEDRFLEVLHEAAMRYSADIVECAILWHEVDGASWRENRGGDRQDLRADEARRAMLSGQLSNSLCNKLVKTELLLSVYEHLSDDGRRVDYGEDLLTLFNLISRVGRFAHIPDPVYRYASACDEHYRRRRGGVPRGEHQEPQPGPRSNTPGSDRLG